VLKTFYLVLFLSLFASDRAFAESLQTLTLDDCIQLAIANATTVLKADNAVKSSGAQVMQTYAQFLPNLQATANYDYADGRTYTVYPTPTKIYSRTYGPSYQLSSSINIFNGFSDYANLKSALDKKQSNEWTLARAKQQISIDVAQAFLQVILDQELVTISKENVKVSEERQNLLKEQTRLGIRDLSDLYRQEAQTSSDEASLITIANKLHDDEIQLSKRIRLDTSKNYAFVDKGLDSLRNSFEDENEEVLIKKALDQRMDYLASKKILSAADWNIDAVQSNYYPKVDLNANVSGAGRRAIKQYVDGVNTTPAQQDALWTQLRHNDVFDIGVSFTWILYDRNVTRYASTQAHIDKSNASIDLEDQRLQVISDVRQASGDLKAAKRRLLAADKGVKASEKAFETVQERYNVGSSSFLDLISAQSTLIDARSTKAEAQIDTLLQERVLNNAVGI